MMQKLYVIKKHVMASSIVEAIAKEKKAEVHEVWLEEGSAKQLFLDLGKNPKKTSMGFRKK